MAVPVAPAIHVNQDGYGLYIRWDAVPTATSYDVYIDGALIGNTAQSVYLTGASESGVVNVTVKAKNGDGDSAASNSVQKNLRGVGPAANCPARRV